jgi:hypothetical protein
MSAVVYWPHALMAGTGTILLGQLEGDGYKALMQQIVFSETVTK